MEKVADFTFRTDEEERKSIRSLEPAYQTTRYCNSLAVNYSLKQCFSTAGPRPGTGPWHLLYRAARGLRKLQYATRFH